MELGKLAIVEANNMRPLSILPVSRDMATFLSVVTARPTQAAYALSG